MELPNKREARKITQKALNEGKLKYKPCKVCGKEEVDIHHLDYSKPLKVLFLCEKHHYEWHKNNPNPPGIVDDPGTRTLKIDSRLHWKLRYQAMKEDITLRSLVEKKLNK